jgi:hypothetical protein
VAILVHLQNYFIAILNCNRGCNVKDRSVTGRNYNEEIMVVSNNKADATNTKHRTTNNSQCGFRLLVGLQVSILFWISPILQKIVFVPLTTTPLLFTFSFNF